MHARILGVALAALATVCARHAWAAGDAPAAPSADCAAIHAAVVERFIGADCADCWARSPATLPQPGQWLLDWIVPSARGDDAPLSPAAPGEASARARRATGAALAEGASVEHASARRSATALRLSVVAGPAWNGYFGVQLDASGALPKGSMAWIALVESVGAGTDGTPVARQLVRTVAGPFELPELRSGRPARVLQAMRWPETSKPERLRARAWIERPDGRMLAMAGERCTVR
jgi:hypothetical protein